jgi:hypothetical protein
MLQHPEAHYTYNQPGSYWCADCHTFTLDCSHLVAPLNAPAVKLDNWQYRAATWARNILQVTMNTGERFQFVNVPRRMAIAFVRKPESESLKAYRFERVRGRAG